MEHVLPRGVVESSVRSVYGDPNRVKPELVDRYYDLTLRAGNREALAFRMDQSASGEEIKIKSLKLPTLIMWGAKDQLIPLDNGNWFESDIKGSKLTIFGDLGHVPHEEDPLRTADAFKAFLKSN